MGGNDGVVVNVDDGGDGDDNRAVMDHEGLLNALAVATAEEEHPDLFGEGVKEEATRVLTIDDVQALFPLTDETTADEDANGDVEYDDEVEYGDANARAQAHAHAADEEKSEEEEEGEDDAGGAADVVGEYEGASGEGREVVEGVGGGVDELSYDGSRSVERSGEEEFQSERPFLSPVVVRSVVSSSSSSSSSSSRRRAAGAGAGSAGARAVHAPVSAAASPPPARQHRRQRQQRQRHLQQEPSPPRQENRFRSRGPYEEQTGDKFERRREREKLREERREQHKNVDKNKNKNKNKKNDPNGTTAGGSGDAGGGKVLSLPQVSPVKMRRHAARRPPHRHRSTDGLAKGPQQALRSRSTRSAAPRARRSAVLPRIRIPRTTTRRAH